MRVGITGHQRLEVPDAWPWVTRMMREELATIPPPLMGVTSLAVGADQLLARTVLEYGGRLLVILPFADIERSFSPADVPAYRELVQQATVEVLNTPGTDEDAYLAAGFRVVDQSDVMMTVWDGQPAKGRGGTAEVVDYALSRAIPLIHFDPIARVVRRIG